MPTGLELIAVVLALAYLLLAIRQSLWCWPAALVSAALYLVLMFEAALYGQSVLQLFYIAMAVYGWWHWQAVGSGEELPVITWQTSDHIGPLLLIALGGTTTGLLLATYSDAAAPWLDAITGWGSIVATWMVARKVLQTWYYWLVIDSVLVYVYLQQGLWLTAGLFIVYLVLVVVAYRQWRASMGVSAHV